MANKDMMKLHPERAKASSDIKSSKREKWCPIEHIFPCLGEQTMTPGEVERGRPSTYVVRRELIEKIYDA